MCSANLKGVDPKKSFQGPQISGWLEQIANLDSKHASIFLIDFDFSAQDGAKNRWEQCRG